MQNSPQSTPNDTVAVNENELGEEQEDTPNELLRPKMNSLRRMKITKTQSRNLCKVCVKS